MGCTEFLNPKELKDKTIQETLIEMTDGGLDFTFECVGNVQTMVSLLIAKHLNQGSCRECCNKIQTNF